MPEEGVVVSEHGVVWAMNSDRARGAAGLCGVGRLLGDALLEKSIVGPAEGLSRWDGRGSRCKPLGWWTGRAGLCRSICVRGVSTSEIETSGQKRKRLDHSKGKAFAQVGNKRT